MNLFAGNRNAACRAGGALLAAALVLIPAPGAGPEEGLHAAELSPFDKLPGRWVGEGRLGFRDGKQETVKCRVTYFASKDGGSGLDQNIRCASQSGKIEVKSYIGYVSGVLTGTWSELMYNFEGNLTGRATPNGFRVQVRGGNVNANMEIVFRDPKQAVEIQFLDSTLVGLTLILQKG